MQAIILAAGMGKRLSELTQNNTKCMVEVHGQPLINYILKSLEGISLNKIVIVVGYEAQGLIDYLGYDFQGTTIEYVHNNDYDSTNNIYSLYLAHKQLGEDDTILLESDLIFDKKIVKRLVEDKRPNLAVVDKYKPWMDGTVVKLDSNHNILNFIPKKHFKFEDSEQYYKTVNIYKFSKKFSNEIYLPFLEAYSKALGKNDYYEQVLRVISFIDKYEVNALPLQGEKWYEIDDKQDLDNAETVFAPLEEKLGAYQKRFGGYWRYPELIDFCYLVNPYFPTIRMEDEIKNYFHRLMREYPSGMNVQKILASSFFECNEHNILIGNGAAEFIPGLMDSLEGTIGIIHPTFNEYPERIAQERIIALHPYNDDYSYDENFIIENSSKFDNLVLINPDNPSGNFIRPKQLIQILDHFKENGKTLVLDESFVDFSEECELNTMIHQNIIDKYHNLVIVKSISKSYGVPGFRLGILISGNNELLKKVHKTLSIWNINSFGEFFLQIIDKYKSDYHLGCQYIADERNRFQEELKKFTFLNVYPSQANYFLCKITAKYTAKQLADILIDKYNILIKDLTGKKGFKEGEYIRLAIRDTNDNNKLIQALHAID
ncbi:aminotransferase class I/II-fold pyridoxal phosphate-dependent enzyme [Carboxylicivirga sp. M1479]|uniref:aminotransferase class I/II-fold pyridoxal phosphate-dependent enzyme n=1 Tax=Carboxylicivirga sp. M1479 TaxID=2594476 RepID=UPI0011781F47|nr:aminotransferase class I/II-fold pyridoxal phosphate-dependent enzyme [Carboxylicivirga sp. M1479]TRX66233.1 aminotransferase class I/II-fold pyridoxal phosphate-dependent enzyme [Carboxylicivirga sp. M1479]